MGPIKNPVCALRRGETKREKGGWKKTKRKGERRENRRLKRTEKTAEEAAEKKEGRKEGERAPRAREELLLPALSLYFSNPRTLCRVFSIDLLPADLLTRARIPNEIVDE